MSENESSLRGRLSPLAYEVTQEKGTERPLPVSLLSAGTTVRIVVWCVKRRCLSRTISLTRVVVGRASMRLWWRVRWLSTQTPAAVVCALRWCVRAVARIWGMCFPMGRLNGRACVIASTALRLSLIKKHESIDLCCKTR